MMIRYSVASWTRRKHSWAAAAAAGSVVTAGGAAFWLAGSNSDDDSSSFERNRGYVTKAEPLLFYEGGPTASVLHDDRPRFGHATTVIAGKPLHQPVKETVDVAATTAAATPGVKPHTVSIQAIKNARITMEDEYCIHDNSFYAIFDGHGGGGVSKYLKQHLYETVQTYVQQHGDAPARALQSAFFDLEQYVTNNEHLRYQGSTAVVVWITANEIIAANVGDSRAVLSRNGHAIPLTRDHKPNDERERDRILQMGETITWDRFSKVHRVKNLSLSRAIGDAYAKPVVSATVDIKHFPLHTTASSLADDGKTKAEAAPVQDEFVILASDGLWDVFTSDDAVAFCHKKLQELDDRSIVDLDSTDRANGKTVLRRNMAKFLTREAVARGSGDNVCVVMIWLDDKDASLS